MKKKKENNGIKKKYCCTGKRIWKESTGNISQCENSQMKHQSMNMKKGENARR
jgi:hypothetical protein